jgi:hypothetical protein
MTTTLSETGQESFLFVDKGTEEFINVLDIPQFSDKNEMEIARYLDSKLKKTRTTNQVPISTQTESTSTDRIKKAVFNSPAPDKQWTPLMQSTPVDIPLKAQPKDILKSKLSKLAQTVETAESRSSSEDDEDISLSKNSSYHDDTPSKPRQRRDVNKSEGTELEELRQLKSLLSTMPNGDSIIENSRSGKTPMNLKIFTTEEISEQDKKFNLLQEDLERIKKLNEDLKEEASIVKSTNIGLKDIIELKDKNIVESRTTIKGLEATIHDLKLSTDEKLSKIMGNSNEQITPMKFPELNGKTSSGLSLYDELELSQLDSLTLIQCQNILKNILINLNIPSSKVRELIPQIALRLHHEDILVDFASRTHKLLYNQQIQMKDFIQSNSRDKLLQCTLLMYKNIELLYAVLNKKP